ncbi:MAG: segregation/condensation protein A, partial [Ignavibacteriales bacterium]|nr:segregation/condensation protein A [Ignavibacteriales bacterium]
FIKRDEIDIKDIPIAKITDEFLGYLRYIEMLDLDIASEFIVMAATLMQIKVKMLLPTLEREGEDEEDPRTDLVRQLLEYKRFKEAAEEFSSLEEERRQLFFRNDFSADEYEKITEEQDALKNVTLFHLIGAFKNVIERMPKISVHTVERLNVTIDEQIDFLYTYFSTKHESTFFELAVLLPTKMHIIVTVLALLELIKSHQILIRPIPSSDDIVINISSRTVHQPISLN